MKIVLRGAFFSNKGAEAMMMTARNQLARRLPDATFHVELPGYQVERGKAEGLHIYERRPIPKSRLGRIATLALASVANPALVRALKIDRTAAFIARDIDFADALVDVSGFAYGDPWGPHCARAAWALATYFESTGRPAVFLPQSWGPFTLPGLAHDINELCKAASGVWGRDQQSYDYLRQAAGDNPKVHRGVDMAWLFESSPLSTGARLLEKVGVRLGAKPLIAVTPNMRVFERLPGSGIDNPYIHLLVTVCRYCASTLGAAVLLAPHEIDDFDPDRDDRRLIRMITEHVGDTPVAAMLEDYTGPDMKAVIANCDMVVGSRFHSIVAAMSSRVPVVALGWSEKYIELLSQAALQKYVVNFDELDEPAVLRLIADAWNSREHNKQLLQQHVPEIERQARELFDEAAELIRGKLA